MTPLERLARIACEILGHRTFLRWCYLFPLALHWPSRKPHCFRCNTFPGYEIYQVDIDGMPYLKPLDAS